jgi:hypothetical protein
MVEFVAALWLLTPWWGRRDLLLVRCHLALAVVLGSVLLGVLIAPTKAIGTKFGSSACCGLSRRPRSRALGGYLRGHGGLVLRPDA